MKVKCFFLEPTANVRVGLRRFHSGNGRGCEGDGYHNNIVPIGEMPAIWDKNGDRDSLVKPCEVARDDPRWPTKCEKCAYQFIDSDVWDIWQELIYKCGDTDELTTLRDAPTGAMWYAHWMKLPGSNINCGPDGQSLWVRCPDKHDWGVDRRSSNCTRKDDAEHRCWCRHGDPRTGNIHVDKDGNTCNAGAGSIQTPSWHGFLTHGYLQEER